MKVSGSVATETQQGLVDGIFFEMLKRVDPLVAFEGGF
jgi:hypothetical protein